MDKKRLKILGVDPGYARAGWSILKKDGQQLELINYGCIETPKKMEHSERLNFLNQELKKIIKRYKPEVLAVEELFFFKNLKTAMKVAEAKGVILMTAFNSKLTIEEYTPLQIKQALAGYGRAGKRQIQYMVKMILKLDSVPKPDDVADAVAVAITCANSVNNHE